MIDELPHPGTVLLLIPRVQFRVIGFAITQHLKMILSKLCPRQRARLPLSRFPKRCST
jgi:hypothetical protein